MKYELDTLAKTFYKCSKHWKWIKDTGLPKHWYFELENMEKPIIASCHLCDQFIEISDNKGCFDCNTLMEWSSIKSVKPHCLNFDSNYTLYKVSSNVKDKKLYATKIYQRSELILKILLKKIAKGDFYYEINKTKSS